MVEVTGFAGWVPGRLSDLVRDMAPLPVRYVEASPEMQAYGRELVRRAYGLCGLPLEDVPVEVAALVRQVGRLLEVEPESQWLFVRDGAGDGLPGGFVLACEGVVQPFSWWLATAAREGRVTVPAGWRLQSFQDTSVLVGIVPA